MKKEGHVKRNNAWNESDFNLKSSQHVLGKYSDSYQLYPVFPSAQADSDFIREILRQLQLQIQFRIQTGFLINPQCGTKDDANVIK